MTSPLVKGSSYHEDVFFFRAVMAENGSELIEAMTHVELVLEVSDKTEVRHPALLNYGPGSSLI